MHADRTQPHKLNISYPLLGFITGLLHLGTGWCVSVSQPPAEVCLSDLGPGECLHSFIQ